MPLVSAKRAGHIENPLIKECSGLDASPTQTDLLWAINDGGNGPYLFAMGHDGRHRGRYRLKGAQNRDWEGLDVFQWKNKTYILIADFGDNRQVRTTHNLYIAREPRMDPAMATQEGNLSIMRHIAFHYPDGRHDGEGITVDVGQKKILMVTKRDTPPLVFEIPLFPPSGNQPVTARLVGALNHLPPLSPEDLSQPYGEFRSQPTALDISADSSMLVLLTYKDAYIFSRHPSANWADVISQHPQRISLPLPEMTPDLRQREAICFQDPARPTTLIVTSEGVGAGIYHVTTQSNEHPASH